MQIGYKFFTYKKGILAYLIMFITFGVLNYLNAVDTCKPKYTIGNTAMFTEAERRVSQGSCNMNGKLIKRFKYDNTVTSRNSAPRCPIGKHLASVEDLTSLSMSDFLSLAMDCTASSLSTHAGTSVIFTNKGERVTAPTDGSGSFSVLPRSTSAFGAAYCVDDTKTREDIMRKYDLVDPQTTNTASNGYRIVQLGQGALFICPSGTRRLRERTINAMSIEDIEILTGHAQDSTTSNGEGAALVGMDVGGSLTRFAVAYPDIPTNPVTQYSSGEGVGYCEPDTVTKQYIMGLYHLKDIRNPVGSCNGYLFTDIGSGDNIRRGDCPKGYSLADRDILIYPSMTWEERYPLQPNSAVEMQQSQFCRDVFTSTGNPNAQFATNSIALYANRDGKYFTTKWNGVWSSAYNQGPTDNRIVGLGYCQRDNTTTSQVRAKYGIVLSTSYNKLCGAESIPVSNTNSAVTCLKGYKPIDIATIKQMTAEEFRVLTKGFGGKTANNCEQKNAQTSRIKIKPSLYATSPSATTIGSTAGSVEYCIAKADRVPVMAKYNLRYTNSTALVCDSDFNIERRPTCDNLTSLVEESDLATLTHKDALILTGGNFQSGGSCSAINSVSDSVFLAVVDGTLEIKSDDSHSFSSYASNTQAAKGVAYCVLKPIDKNSVMQKYRLSTPLRSVGNCSSADNYPQFSSDVNSVNYPYCPDGTKLMDYELFSKMNPEELTALSGSYQALSTFTCAKASNKNSILLLDDGIAGSYQANTNSYSKSALTASRFIGAYCAKAPTQADIMAKYKLVYADKSGWSGSNNCNKVINTQTSSKICDDGYEPLDSRHLSNMPKEDVLALTKNPFYDSSCSTSQILKHYILTLGLPQTTQEAYYNFAYPTFSNTGVGLKYISLIGNDKAIAYCKKVDGVYSEARRYGILKAKTSKKCNDDYMFDPTSDSCPNNFRLVTFNSISLNNRDDASVQAMFNSISGKTIDASNKCVNVLGKKVIRLFGSTNFLQYYPKTNTTTFTSNPNLDVGASNVLVPAFCVRDMGGSFDIP